MSEDPFMRSKERRSGIIGIYLNPETADMLK